MNDGFIPCLWEGPHRRDCWKSRRAHAVPKGYIWHPATDHTAAGWARPAETVDSGSELQTPDLSHARNPLYRRV